MNPEYDFLNLFLIFFIFYYLLTIVSTKNIIEGQDNSSIMCRGNIGLPESDLNECLQYPYTWKSTAGTTKQCIDGTDTCSEESKIDRCCSAITELCQGNIDSSKDVVCDDGSWPKVNSAEIPYECMGSISDDPHCWSHDKPLLSERDYNERQLICCTEREDAELAEQFWGIPYLINKGSKLYDDSKIIRSTDPDQADTLLNDALEKLNEARNIDDSEYPRYGTIMELISDWGDESGKGLGSGMCRGNIDRVTDFQCIEEDREYINEEFIKEGTTRLECCVTSGLCSGNTEPSEDFNCPENTRNKDDVYGSTKEECCEDDVTCRGNTNINLNFNCPPPMVPIKDSNSVFGNTQEDCCRFPDDKHITELILVSENETIYGTLIINGDIYESAGLEGSSKRIMFESNFKKDISNILSKEGKVNILPEQIIIDDIYTGSIIIDFQVIPHNTGISITKEYFAYLLSEKIYLPELRLYTASGVTNVGVISWYNIDDWPQWIWYVIIIIITFLISITLLL